MSLGFLTESALVPSKAKAIQVDSKSIVDLKALIFRKEKERQERKQHLNLNSNTRQHSKRNWKLQQEAQSYAKLRKTTRTPKVNRNIKDRQLRDEAIESEERMKDDVKVWEAKSRAILERKAKLYDAMARGQIVHNEQDTVLLSECLIDFKSKAKDNDAIETHTTEEYVTVLDEFGRSRKLVKDSAAHRQHEEAVTKNSDTIASEQDNSGFVVSQWERRLSTNEKLDLQQIHQSVRKAHSNITDRKEHKQKRFQKLCALRNDIQPTQNESNRAEKGSNPLPVASAESENASQLANAFLEDLLAR